MSNLSHAAWIYFRLYYIKQYIPKLVIADDREATFEGKSSQPENSGDTLTQIRVEVKRLVFCRNIWK